MTLFQLTGIVLTMVAVLGFLNYKFLKLPDTLGITLMGLMTSVFLIIAGTLVPVIHTKIVSIIAALDFQEIVFHGMLGLLLFAGSLHVNIQHLKEKMWPIFLLATVAVLLATGVIGVSLYLVLPYLGIDVPILYCLMFGAAISPTDPIAVMAILKQLGVDKGMETKIAGESMFNDASGVVVYMTLASLLTASTGAAAVSVDWGSVMHLVLFEVLGAVVLGLLLGYVATWMLEQVDSYPVEIMITLALALGGYALAEAVHASAPLTSVITGLYIGNRAVEHAMSERTRSNLTSFWDLLDELLNLVLFGLIGLKVASVDVSSIAMLAGMIAIVVCLIGRWVSVAIPIASLRLFAVVEAHSIKVLTWGGLRGAISIALVLSMPSFASKDAFVVMAYSVVLFSLLVQALTLKSAMAKWGATSKKGLKDES